MNKQLISSEEKKRREHLLQIKYQTIILHHLAKSKLDNSEFEALNNSLEKNRKIFSDVDIFVDFSNWS